MSKYYNLSKTKSPIYNKETILHLISQDILVLIQLTLKFQKQNINFKTNEISFITDTHLSTSTLETT